MTASPRPSFRAAAAAGLALLLPACLGQTTSTAAAAGACPTVLKPKYAAPVVGAGWTAQLVVTGLRSPRGILFDGNGALLVVQAGTGIQHITFNDYGGTCLTVNSSTTLISSSDLNHGIELSGDSKTLYASSSEAVFSWAYDAGAASVGGANTTLIQNMSNADHTSRTLLLSKKASGTLLVSRGSSENMDFVAQQLDSGHSQIRAFDVGSPPATPYDYPSAGRLVGWGLRNSVGVAEEPLTGGLFSVENSADNIQREGQDIHQDDPGEEMNFHGFLNESAETQNGQQGGNYGYPDCFALWGASVPDLGGLAVGSQFALNPNATLNDTTCAREYIAPRLTFQAHTAPLDIIFTPDGAEAYVTFHGSWNRDVPVGYKLSSIAFAGGQPVAAPDSTASTADLLSNADLTACPNACFRPVGLALDAQGRLFMSADSTGEIYVLQKGAVTAQGGGGTTTSPSSSAPGASGSSANLAPRSGRTRPGEQGVWLAVAAAVLSLLGGAVVFAA